MPPLPKYQYIVRYGSSGEGGWDAADDFYTLEDAEVRFSELESGADPGYSDAGYSCDWAILQTYDTCDIIKQWDTNNASGP